MGNLKIYIARTKKIRRMLRQRYLSTATANACVLLHNALSLPLIEVICVYIYILDIKKKWRAYKSDRHWIIKSVCWRKSFGKTDHFLIGHTLLRAQRLTVNIKTEPRLEEGLWVCSFLIPGWNREYVHDASIYHQNFQAWAVQCMHRERTRVSLFLVIDLALRFVEE